MNVVKRIKTYDWWSVEWLDFSVGNLFPVNSAEEEMIPQIAFSVRTTAYTTFGNLYNKFVYTTGSVANVGQGH